MERTPKAFEWRTIVDHVKFGVSDYAASKAFFLKALEPLGVAVVAEGPPSVRGRAVFKG